MRELRNSKKAEGHDRIYTAGEKEYIAWMERRGKGLFVNESVRKDLVEVRDKLGMNFKFPFEA